MTNDTLHREIIFRGMTIRTKKWVYGFLTKDFGRFSIDGFEVFAESIGQYTGFKTKIGVRIFENDILICSEYDSRDTEKRIVQTFKNALVYFTQGSFYYCPNCNPHQPHQLLMYACNTTVVGNTTQNPELLK